VRAAKFAPYVASTDRVMEFGVGAGWNLAALECRERTGIDIGGHLAPALRALGIGFAEDSAAIADDSAEILICHHVLEHVVSPADTLAELRRLLAPAGRLLLFVPYESEGRYRRYHPGEPNHHLFAWNAQTLGNLVADCGFQIVSADVVRYGYERAAAVVAHRLGVGEQGFRLLRQLAHLLKPAREVRIIAAKPAART
jgi:SAM-dependent methyltransferase